MKFTAAKVLLRSARMKPYFELKKLKVKFSRVCKQSLEPAFDSRMLQSIGLPRRALIRLVAYTCYLR